MADLEPILEPTRLKHFRVVSFFRKLLKEPPSTQVSISIPHWQPKVTVYRFLPQFFWDLRKLLLYFTGNPMSRQRSNGSQGSQCLVYRVEFTYVTYIAHLTNVPVFM